jgi:glucosamine-phosphate N-acetyltransferase
LYDPSLLLKLDFFKSPAKFNPPITAVAPGEPWLSVRPLKSGDYRRGFLQSLSQLTNVGEISETQFLSKYNE